MQIGPKGLEFGKYSVDYVSGLFRLVLLLILSLFYKYVSYPSKQQRVLVLSNSLGHPKTGNASTLLC